MIFERTQILRRLSWRQRQALAAMPAYASFNILKIAGIGTATVSMLTNLGLVERGARGFDDARLTPLGRSLRAELLMPGRTRYA